MRYALGCHFKLWSNKSVIGVNSDEIIAHVCEKYFRTHSQFKRYSQEGCLQSSKHKILTMYGYWLTELFNLIP